MHLNQQNPSVSPNAEDMSLILGSMARGRSFSTTINPMIADMSSSTSQPPPAKEKTSASVGSAEVSSSVIRRKKSTSTTQTTDSSTAEEFFIETIIQRHARRLLQDKKLEALGYMSAALDFHLVGWLAREKDRAARIEDFVAALKQLHEDFDWPKPNLDLKLNRRSSDKWSQQQQTESPSHSLQSLRVDTHLGTGDSGYTSLPAHLDNLPHDPSNMSSTEWNQTVDSPYVFNPELCNLAVQNLQNRFQDLDRISEEGDVRSNHHAKSRGPFRSERNGSLLSEIEADLLPLDSASVISEQVSQWGEDNSLTFDANYDRTVETLATHSSRAVSHKVEVKTRYLLQIFTEGCCFDFALLLSIILLDAASISRITHSAIRSGSLSVCRQLRNGLKDITRWSFQEWCVGNAHVAQLSGALTHSLSFHFSLGYRPFMIILQPQVSLLDKFVIAQESIPIHFINNCDADRTDSLIRNVSA